MKTLANTIIVAISLVLIGIGLMRGIHPYAFNLLLFLATLIGLGTILNVVVLKFWPRSRIAEELDEFPLIFSLMLLNAVATFCLMVPLPPTPLVIPMANIDACAAVEVLIFLAQFGPYWLAHREELFGY